MEKKLVRTHQDLKVYQMAFKVAMQIFDESKSFPIEERYSLTDQVRRSSRSVCANLAEGWRKRRYEASFLSKLSDAEAEAAESQVWLEFASQCGYLKEETVRELLREALYCLHFSITILPIILSKAIDITRSIYLFALPPLEKGGKGGFESLENPPMSPFAKGGSFIRNLKIVIEKCKQYNASLNNSRTVSSFR